MDNNFTLRPITNSVKGLQILSQHNDCFDKNIFKNNNFKIYNELH